jgi:hypothetical protein
MWWWYSGYAENVGGIFNEVVFLPPPGIYNTAWRKEMMPCWQQRQANKILMDHFMLLKQHSAELLF